MTTHVEQVVTEVIPEPETSESGEAPDPRWHEQEKYEGMIAHHVRLAERIRSEGFND